MFPFRSFFSPILALRGKAPRPRLPRVRAMQSHASVKKLILEVETAGEEYYRSLAEKV